MADSSVVDETYVGQCDKHGEFVGKRAVLMGRAFHLGCPACSAARKEAEAEAARLEQEALERRATEADKQRLRDSGVPLRFEGKTLDNFETDSDGRQKAHAQAARLVDAIVTSREAPNLIMIGKPGTGKSHLCCAIVSALYRKYRVARIDLPDLIREIRATWGRKSEATEQEVLDYYGSLDLLILEEVGTGAGTDDERARVFQVINRRYEAMLPTVVVSNLDLAALRAEMGDRVIDRLREGEKALVVFDWESARK